MSQSNAPRIGVGAMNRKERRNAVKQGYSDKDIKKCMDIDRRKFQSHLVRMYSTAVAWVLYNKLGFGAKKLQMTVKQINDTFEMILEDYVTVEDMQKALAEEVGVGIG